MFVLGTCVVCYALSTKLPPGKHPWALTAAKPTNYVARRWNSDVHMSRFGNCWQSCVAGQCSGESSFLQDKKTWCMWWVCQMSWCLNCIRVIAAMCVCVNSVTIPLNRPTSFQSPHNTITQIFGMEDGCTEDPIKPQNCQNCGMSTSMEWVLGLMQYGDFVINSQLCNLLLSLCSTCCSQCLCHVFCV